MRQALYRKYRPKTLSEVVGQEYLKTTLGNQLSSGQVGHAYLFSGPKGTGKTTVARILAKSVNCLEYPSFAKATEDDDKNNKKGVSKKGEPCGKCAMCKMFEENQMMDLIEIDAASNRSIDNIRELISKIALAPSQGKYKVYVIDEAHQLTKEASNALLKTLEEPPAHAIFVLATTDPDKLLPTIVSRCQRFDFRYVPVDAAVKCLAEIAKAEKINISQDGLEFIARQSGGGMRDAESLLEQASFIEGEITQAKLTDWLGLVDWQTVCEMTNWLVKGQAKELLNKIDELYHNGYDLSRLTASWTVIVRQILAVKFGNAAKLSITGEQVKQLERLAAELSVNQLVMILQELMAAGRDVKVAVIPQTPLEVMVVKLTSTKATPVQSDDKHDDGAAGAGTKEEKVSEPAKSESEPVAEPARISSDELMAIWPKVLEEMKSVSPTLTGMLMGAQVREANGTIELKFSQKFYQEKMEQAGSRKLLNEALAAVGYTCQIVCLVEEQTTEQPIDIQNVSEVFGGLS